MFPRRSTSGAARSSATNERGRDGMVHSSAVRRDRGDDRQHVRTPGCTSTGFSGEGDRFDRTVYVGAYHRGSSFSMRTRTSNVATVPSILLHFLAAEELVCTPLRDLGGLVAEFDALALLVARSTDLGDCLCKRTLQSRPDRSRRNGGACTFGQRRAPFPLQA